MDIFDKYAYLWCVAKLFCFSIYAITRIAWYFHKIRACLYLLELVKGGGGGVLHTVSSTLTYVRGYRNSSVKKVRVNKQPGRSLKPNLTLWCFLYFMNEKFMKNTKVEQLTKMFLSRGEEKALSSKILSHWRLQSPFEIFQDPSV